MKMFLDEFKVFSEILTVSEISNSETVRIRLQTGKSEFALQTQTFNGTHYFCMPLKVLNMSELLTNIGYRLLSEENTQGYTAGSERKYYQELFDDFKNNAECDAYTREISVEGSPSAGFGHENVTEYIISSNGTVQLRVIDVNNDGKVDYAYKY